MIRGRYSKNKKWVLSHLSRNYNLKENVIKINCHNTTEHELAKAIICIEIAKNGTEFYTECIFKSGQRADIVDINSLIIIEILHSETKEMVEKNKKNYPFPIICLNSDEVIKKYIKKYEKGRKP